MLHKTVSGAATVIGLALLLHQPMAMSSGFAIPESSAAGLGTANAIVANPEDRGAFAYNPAAMGFHDNSSIAFGAILYGPQISVNTLSGRSDSQGAHWLATPAIQAALRVGDRWWLGLGINAPFGLETRWRLGTFPVLSQPIPTPVPGLALPAGLDHPTQSKLEVIAVVPTATFKVSDNLTVSVGADYFNAREATLNTYVTGLDGDGKGWGWNSSALYNIGPWSLGAAFHSASTIALDGRVTSNFPVASSSNASVDLNLPWRLQLGLRYAVSENLAIEFDWNRTGWSQFDELVVKEKSRGSVVKVDPNEWEDSNAYRVSMILNIRPSTRLRFGYAFDQTGQPGDYFTPRIPDNDRHLFSLGIGQALSDGWSLDAAYTYVRFDDRDYVGTKPYVPAESINGTFTVSGAYALSAHVFALEASKAF